MQTQAEKECRGGKAGRMSKSNEKGDAINDGDNKNRNTEKAGGVWEYPHMCPEVTYSIGWGPGCDRKGEEAVREKDTRMPGDTHRCT